MPQNVLICGANWLGDCVMSMPAIQSFKRKYPSCRVTMLTKSKLCSLWAIHPCIDAVIALPDGFLGAMKTSGMVRECKFDEAYVFPNSFRSALIPFLAGVPRRSGVVGHQRQWMLTDVVHLSGLRDRSHQAWEYMDMLGLSVSCSTIDDPKLVIPEDKICEARLTLEKMKWNKCLGLMPGAAYGPAKRWPVEFFVEVGREFARNGYGIAVMGSAAEVAICSSVSSSVGEQSLNLAGRTSLSELSALLSLCSAVVTNDSGGMHLASAVGRPVVAVFGITDPSKTGPLGKKSRVICAEGVNRSRDIERVSMEAEASLKSVKPEKVCKAVMELLDSRC